MANQEIPPAAVLSFKDVEKIETTFGSESIDLKKLFPNIESDDSESWTKILGVCRHENRYWIVSEVDGGYLGTWKNARALTEAEERAFLAERRRIHSPGAAARTHLEEMRRAQETWESARLLLASRLPASLQTFAEEYGWTRNGDGWQRLPDYLLLMGANHAEGRPYELHLMNGELKTCGFKSFDQAVAAFQELPAAWMNSVRVEIDRKTRGSITIRIFPAE